MFETTQVGQIAVGTTEISRLSGRSRRANDNADAQHVVGAALVDEWGEQRRRRRRTVGGLEEEDDEGRPEVERIEQLAAAARRI